MRQLELSGLSTSFEYNEPDEKVYFCFHLTHDKMSSRCAKELEELGVECLMDGKAGEAYGIAPNTAEFMDDVGDLDEIKYVEHREPPSGM